MIASLKSKGLHFAFQIEKMKGKVCKSLILLITLDTDEGWGTIVGHLLGRDPHPTAFQPDPVSLSNLPIYSALKPTAGTSGL